jgi:hypothetical protein
MIYLVEKDSGKQFSFLCSEISELDNFTPEEAISFLGSEAIELCDEKYGHWKMRLKSGQVFHAFGTTHEYDKIVRLIIKRHK